MASKKEDSVDKLTNLIEERIKSAFEDRDRTQKEASDPWARIEGIIDRTVAKHFQALGNGLEEGESKERKPGAGERKAGGGFLKALGLEDEEAS